MKKVKSIQEKQGKVGIDGQETIERKLFLVDNLLSEVNNGGFEQYFSISMGIYWDETTSELEKLNLKSLVDLVIKAYSIYESNESDDMKLGLLEKLEDKFYKINYQRTYRKLLTLFNSIK